MPLPIRVYFLILVVLLELLADMLAKHFAVSGKLVFAALALIGFLATNKEKANRYQLIGLTLGIAAIAFLSVE